MKKIVFAAFLAAGVLLVGCGGGDGGNGGANNSSNIDNITLPLIEEVFPPYNGSKFNSSTARQLIYIRGDEVDIEKFVENATEMHFKCIWSVDPSGTACDKKVVLNDLLYNISLDRDNIQFTYLVILTSGDNNISELLFDLDGIFPYIDGQKAFRRLTKESKPYSNDVEFAVTNYTDELLEWDFKQSTDVSLCGDEGLAKYCFVNYTDDFIYIFLYMSNYSLNFQYAEWTIMKKDMRPYVYM